MGVIAGGPTVEGPCIEAADRNLLSSTRGNPSWTRAIVRLSNVAVFAVAPTALTIGFIVASSHHGLLALDFHHAFRPAGDAVLHGRSPYPPPTAAAVAPGTAFVYLPPAAFLFVPFALLPPLVADVLATIIVVLAGALALWVVGVRDWRVYGLALWWAPVASALQTANVTLVLALGLALLWRLRNRPRAAACVGAGLLATKIFLWPVVAVWLGATRRYRAAAISVSVGIALTLAAWAAIGFRGFLDYPRLLKVLSRHEAHESYTLAALGAHSLGICAAVAALAACVMLGRRGDDRRAFVLAVVASLLFSPIVWLHYFALLLVPIAVMTRRPNVAWSLPALLWLFASGTGNGTGWQTGAVLATMAFATAAALSSAPEDEDQRQRFSPSRSTLLWSRLPALSTARTTK